MVWWKWALVGAGAILVFMWIRNFIKHLVEGESIGSAITKALKDICCGAFD